VFWDPEMLPSNDSFVYVSGSQPIETDGPLGKFCLGSRTTTGN